MERAGAGGGGREGTGASPPGPAEFSPHPHPHPHPHPQRPQLPWLTSLSPIRAASCLALWSMRLTCLIGLIRASA